MPKKRSDSLPSAIPSAMPDPEARLRQSHREEFERNPAVFSYVGSRCAELGKAQQQVRIETELASGTTLHRALDRARNQMHDAESSILNISRSLGDRLADSGVTAPDGSAMVLSAKGSCQELEAAAVNIRAGILRESQSASGAKPRSR